MSVRYSKRHVRREKYNAPGQWTVVADGGLHARVHPPHWKVARPFDFRFLTALVDESLARAIAHAFSAFAVRFARTTAVSRYQSFVNLWRGLAPQITFLPARNVRVGPIAVWLKAAVRDYGVNLYSTSRKQTSAKVALQNLWTVLDELASCGLLVDIPPIEPPKNLHLRKVPRPALVEQAEEKSPRAAEQSELIRHFEALGIPVEEESKPYLGLLAGLLTEEQRRDSQSVHEAYVKNTQQHLKSLIAASESQFLKWQDHYTEGQQLLGQANAAVLSAFDAGEFLSAEPHRFRRYFPKDEPQTATANLLLLCRERYGGRVPTAAPLELPWRSRFIILVTKLGGRYHLDSMLTLHRTAVAAAAFMYIADTGANVSTALTLESTFERPTSETSIVEFFAVKARARYAAIYDALPVDEPGRRISTVHALRATLKMTNELRRRVPALGDSLLVFNWYREPSVGGIL